MHGKMLGFGGVPDGSCSWSGPKYHEIRRCRKLRMLEVKLLTRGQIYINSCGNVRKKKESVEKNQRKGQEEIISSDIEWAKG